MSTNRVISGTFFAKSLDIGQHIVYNSSVNKMLTHNGTADERKARAMNTYTITYTPDLNHFETVVITAADKTKAYLEFTFAHPLSHIITDIMEISPAEA